MKILLTAGHVIMDGKYKSVLIPKRNSEGAFSLKGVWYPSETNHKLGKDEDDYAYLIMTDEAYSNFITYGYKFINISNIDFTHVPNKKNIYTLVGCKWRKTKKVGRDTHVKVEILSNYGAEDHAYKLKDNKDRRIIIANSRKMVNKENNKELVGKLEGMSGGAIWYTDYHHNYNLDQIDIQLVGVLNSYNSTFIYGTNISRLLATLVERNHGNFK